MTPAEVEAAVGRAIDAKLGQFYIDREAHYRDHEFIQNMRKWADETKGTLLRTVVNTLALGIVGLMVLGFIVWGRSHFGKG